GLSILAGRRLAHHVWIATQYAAGTAVSRACDALPRARLHAHQAAPQAQHEGLPHLLAVIPVRDPRLVDAHRALIHRAPRLASALREPGAHQQVLDAHRARLVRDPHAHVLRHLAAAELG